MSDETLALLKEGAEFFPAGKIIPQRILKVPRKLKHRTIFGSDTWVLNTPGGYVCMTDIRVGGSAVKIAQRNRFFENLTFRIKKPYCGKKPRKTVFKGSPYHIKGITQFFGNAGLTDEQWVSNVLAAIKGES